MLFFRLLVGFFIVLMTSCSTYQTFIVHAQNMKNCKLACEERLKQCSQVCRNSCQNCTKLSNAEAAVHFIQYKKQQNIQGQIVALEMKSFQDPLKCRKTTCDCKADFGLCIQSCRGIIRKNLRVVTHC